MKKFLIKILLIFMCFSAIIPLYACDGSIKLEKYDNAEQYSIGDTTCYEDVNKVVVYWLTGSIKLKNNSENVCVSEDNSNLSLEQKVHTYFKDGVFYVQYWQSEYSSKIAKDEKIVTISIPSDVEVVINSKGSDIIVENEFSIKQMQINAQESNINFEHIKADSLNVVDTSGEITIKNLYVKNLDINANTAKVGVTFKSNTYSTIKSTTGDVELGISVLGATITFSSQKGKIQTSKAYDYESGIYVFGTGKFEINVETSKGNLIIK